VPTEKSEGLTTGKNVSEPKAVMASNEMPMKASMKLTSKRERRQRLIIDQNLQR
jgi:hypothetical protein